MSHAANTTHRITNRYPKLDCIILNAGFQRTLNFTKPESVDISSAEAELRTNYLSPLAAVTAFLPHLTSLAPQPTGIYLVSSGLALVPITRCPNYCATKAAVHSLAYTLRAQLEESNVKVVEIMPPAVQTELHTQQADLVAAGESNFGLPLDEYTDETWGLMSAEEEHEEIVVSALSERFEAVDEKRKVIFKKMVEAMNKNGGKFGEPKQSK
jgi:short-subunit dehydrogenase involved in D-alanine esterification of teichoic acids